MADSGYNTWATVVALLCIVAAIATFIPGLQPASNNNLPVYFAIVALAAVAWPTVRNLTLGKEGISVEKFESVEKGVHDIDRTVKSLEASITEVKALGGALGQHVAALASSLEAVQLGNRELKMLLDEARRSAAIVGSGAGAAGALRGKDAAALKRPPTHPDDPQKERWGGKPENNGWRLSASVTPSALDSQWHVVEINVSSTMQNRGLRGPVSFFVHNSFPQERYDVKPIDGVAMLELRAWGAFTIGAWVTEDDTELELDLAELQNAPADFRSR